MRLIILLLLIGISSAALAQTDSTKAATTPTPAPYLKSPFIPTFSIQLPDSSWFFNTNLKAKPVLIVYFSPDCGHCQIETEALMSKASDLKNVQIIMITSRPFEDMVNFISHYKLRKFPGIIVGEDHARVITKFYDVKHTPFSALYDKRGKLLKVYRDGINMNELVGIVNHKFFK